MTPQIIKNDKYIEVIGHYDSEVLCAKLTLLADLYAVEHREGYAKFDIKDEDKLRLIDDRLEFAGEATPGDTPTEVLSDLTGTKWVWNDEIDIFSFNASYAINFTSNNTNYMYIFRGTGSIAYSKNRDGTNMTYVYDSGQEPPFIAGWADNAYKTIEITGGTDATNATLITCLQANATQIIEPTGHTLTYSGDLSSYLTVKVNNVSVSSGTTINNGDKVEVYLDNSYPNYELLVNDKEITDNTIRVINEDIDIEVNEVVDTNCLTFSSPNTFTLNVVGNTKYWDGTLEYSTDTTTWTTWDGTTTLSSTQSGDTKYLYIRGSNNTYITGWKASLISKAYWVLTGSNISCNGNIETLLDYQTVVNGNHPNMAGYCYYNMFYNCASLITPPALPATTLSDYCYYNMFYNCTSLITPPALPATTLSDYCYYGMFESCTSLTTAPTLSAITLATRCYNRMFYGCKSLTSAPELPATTLTSSCYYGMFYGCTSLTVPAIMAGGTTQATAAKNCCYRMYYNCTSLNIYTSSSGHTAFYKSIAFSETSSNSIYRSSYQMFYKCKINGATSTTIYLTAETQYYY